MSDWKQEQSASSTDVPVVLCHAASTGGSLVYRLMISSLGFCGVSEIGHARRPPAKRFTPLDPESQMFLRGDISYLEFGEILFRRIKSAENIARQSGKRLLIREHTQGFFFGPDSDATLPEEPSWIIERYKSSSGTVPPLVVSVRDPIDSWLGFRRNFDHEKPTEFAEYCRIYNEFMDRVDHAHESGEPVYLFKYEDLVDDEDRILSEIARFVGQSYSGVDHEAAAITVSSGNSGRSSVMLSKRARRPFTSKLLRAAGQSSEYVRLCKRLDYDCIHWNLGVGDRLKAKLYLGVAYVSGFTQWLESPARWAYDKLSGSRNIQ